MVVDSYAHVGLDQCRSADETAQWFHDQLVASLAGEKSGVHAYRTVHSHLAGGVAGQSALVAVANSRGLHIARAEIQSGRWKLQDVGQWTGLSALVHPETCEEYFDCIAAHLAPHVNPRHKIGLCLPWPLEAEGMSNVVRPSAGSPDHMHLNGVDPARELMLALDRLGVGSQRSVRCIAAPVAVLLAGLVLPETTLRNTASLILDGGGQAAYVEQCRLGRPVIAVTVDLDILSDLAPVEAAASGERLHDMPSLGGVVRLWARHACSEGCFTPAAARQIRALKRLPALSVCTWLEERRPEPTMDEAAFQAIVDQVLRRVARRYAATVAGILPHAAQHSSGDPAFLVIHGDFYRASRILRDCVSDELRSIELSRSIPQHHCAQVVHDLLIGTACAALQCTACELTAPKKDEANAV